MNVVTVEDKGEKAAILVMEDGSRVWTPEKSSAVALVGKPIPADWTQKQGEYGPQAFPPRPKPAGGGGFSAYRNTREGMAAEQQSIHASVALEHATALQASGYGLDAEAGGGAALATLALATEFYEWLRKTAVAPPAPPGRGDAAAGTVVIPAPTVPANREQAPAEKEGGEGVGEGAFAPEGSAGACSHDQVTFFKPPPNEDVRLPAGKVRCVACGKIVKEQGP